MPKYIARRLYSLSSSKEIFLETAQSSEKNLASCGYKEKVTYAEQSVKNQQETKKKTQKKNVMWFNPPYSKIVKTNIGYCFFRLINSLFPPEHKLHKIFNIKTR